MSPPVGPTGVPQSCEGTSPRDWRVGAGVAGFDTVIVFKDAGRASFQQLGLAASLDRRLSTRFTLQLALGASIGGNVVVRGIAERIRPGLLASIGASYRIVDDSARSPFVVGTASIAQSFVSTASSSLRATDGRLGVVVGKMLGPIAPFLAARAFYGPVYYAGDTGSDRYHYQIGAGVLTYVKGFDAAVEVAFLGERRFTLGVGYSF